MGQCSPPRENLCWAEDHTDRQKLKKGKRKTYQAAICYRKSWVLPHTYSASSSGDAQCGKDMDLLEQTQRKPQKCPKAGAPLFWRQKAGGAQPGEEKAPEELWFSSNVSENLKTNQSLQKVAKPKSFAILWTDNFWLEVGGYSKKGATRKEIITAFQWLPKIP